MMDEFREKAWAILTKQEQDSLFLGIGQGRSTWEVGGLMGISHYKYLELKDRAEKFFKLFSDYFYKYPDLIRPEAPLAFQFRDYLYGIILKRLGKKDSSIYAGDSAWFITEIKSKKIISNMLRLKESENEWDRDLYALVMEFDRWNNFRILPRAIQAPSAYPRRNNKRHKVYLSYLHRIPNQKISAILDKFWKRRGVGGCYYMALISSIFKYGYQVVPISRKLDITKEISKFKIYIFENQEDADTFGVMALSFLRNTSSASGLKFWKEYREIIEKAINYKNINNMDFTCYSLDMSYGLKRKPPKRPKKELQK